MVNWILVKTIVGEKGGERFMVKGYGENVMVKGYGEKRWEWKEVEEEPRGL